MSNRHAVVWLDHRGATIARLSHDTSSTIHVTRPLGRRRLHVRSGVPGSGHAADDLVMFDEIAGQVADNDEILVAGPGVAKVAFQRHVAKHHPTLALRIVGVETVDHPTSRELTAFAREQFARVDALNETPANDLPPRML